MNRNRRNLRKRRGATLLEVITATGLSSMMLFGALSVFLHGSASWLRGTAKINVNEDAQGAVRAITQELREAMSVAVDGDGLGLSYRLPQVDGNGDYVVPAVWDGIERRIDLDDGRILLSADGADDKVLCRGVILTDPLSGTSATYKTFTAGAGTITRQLTVMVVTKANEYRKEDAKSRSRETVFLRNIPELTR